VSSNIEMIRNTNLFKKDKFIWALIGGNGSRKQKLCKIKGKYLKLKILKLKEVFK
jgi:hypothetical protein